MNDRTEQLKEDLRRAYLETAEAVVRQHLKHLPGLSEDEEPTNPRFRCGMHDWFLTCSYDKKGVCTLALGKGVKCVSRWDAQERQ